MANIMINQSCNLHCPYCFANEYVNKPCNLNSNISIDNFKQALDFVAKTDHHVGIIGGEPTLHDKFKEILELVIDNKNIETSTIFTNGVELDRYFNIISNRKFGYLVNVNPPSDMGKGLFDKMVKNLDTMHFERYLGDRTTLGINMYKPDFEYDYMIQLLLRYKKKSVRTSIAVPNSDKLRNMSPLDYFKEMKPRVMEFFNACKQIGVMPHFDCNGFPMCSIDAEDLKFLQSFYPMEKESKQYCNLADGNVCSPVIDIMPDLSTARCFGVKPDTPTYIYNFNDINDLRAYYTTYYDALARLIPVSDKCTKCKQYRNSKCNGGCLSFKLPELNAVRDKVLTAYTNRNKSSQAESDK